MITIYLDLFTSVLFFVFIGYFERRGLPKSQTNTSIHFQKINQFIYHNRLLYVLPYFYSITLISDFENLLGLKTYAIQIVYFLLFMVIQLFTFLWLQSYSVVIYFILLKNVWLKFRLKFFKSSQHSVANDENDAKQNVQENTQISFDEFDLLLNSFALPSFLILTNSYFFTKIIFFIFNRN